ncbi:glycosyl transferase group 1 [Hymenobacter roseosalivarius DSM 11622]|uniref:Glycosyl transferase group 1 n=1 Tax=Hymenobacter roseosalivarius DSM 11622 TaxID=645990 RepID=A0A1W1V8C5_9BACT|nr:glycosyltransferase family 4 protein [Hymenobacter roseosalivarius]SMB89565.1 glycosyl transferase group 1 [Hymenobacter roseosalivarius DSM 11622]
MRIAYVVSGVDRMLILERTLLELSFSVEHLVVIQLNPASKKLSEFLQKQAIKTEIITTESIVSWVLVIARIQKILRKEAVDIAHVHFFLAGLLGITAAWLARVPYRIYTRHHGSEHHMHHPKGVVMDKYINCFSTDIIAISPAVQDILVHKEKVSVDKISFIPHGLDFETYINTSDARIEGLRNKYEIKGDDFPVIGVIARYDEPKGHQYIIQAFQMVLEQFPRAKLVLANARGPYKGQVQQFLKTIPTTSFTEIEYEYDVISMYKLFDVFMHLPTSADYESFGLVYLEALALSIPSVFTISGIASEFLKDGENALIVPYRDATAAATAIQQLINDPDLAARLKSQGKADVLGRFSFDNYFSQLLQLYRGKTAA